MANRFLTTDEIGERFRKAIQKAAKGLTVKQQRAFFYDLQTSLCGFPRTEKQGKLYIETGHC
jgi:hypothetical protein